MALILVNLIYLYVSQKSPLRNSHFILNFNFNVYVWMTDESYCRTSKLYSRVLASGKQWQRPQGACKSRSNYPTRVLGVNQFYTLRV